MVPDRLRAWAGRHLRTLATRCAAHAAVTFPHAASQGVLATAQDSVLVPAGGRPSACWAAAIVDHLMPYICQSKPMHVRMQAQAGGGEGAARGARAGDPGPGVAPADVQHCIAGRAVAGQEPAPRTLLRPWCNVQVHKPSCCQPQLWCCAAVQCVLPAPAAGSDLATCGRWRPC